MGVLIFIWFVTGTSWMGILCVLNISSRNFSYRVCANFHNDLITEKKCYERKSFPDILVSYEFGKDILYCNNPWYFMWFYECLDDFKRKTLFEFSVIADLQETTVYSYKAHGHGVHRFFFDYMIIGMCGCECMRFIQTSPRGILWKIIC